MPRVSKNKKIESGKIKKASTKTKVVGAIKKSIAVEKKIEEIKPKKISKNNEVEKETEELLKESVVSSSAPKMFQGMPKAQYWYGLGRRKTAKAQVRLYEGNGLFVINGKTPNDYFGGFGNLVNLSLSPLVLLGNLGKFDTYVKVSGGGLSGQAEAIRLGIARALLVYNSEFRPNLRKAGFLTRNPRVKERKKPGLRRARRAQQFSKR